MSKVFLVVPRAGGSYYSCCAVRQEENCRRIQWIGINPNSCIHSGNPLVKCINAFFHLRGGCGWEGGSSFIPRPLIHSYHSFSAYTCPFLLPPLKIPESCIKACLCHQCLLHESLLGHETPSEVETVLLYAFHFFCIGIDRDTDQFRYQ